MIGLHIPIQSDATYFSELPKGSLNNFTIQNIFVETKD